MYTCTEDSALEVDNKRAAPEGPIIQKCDSPQRHHRNGSFTPWLDMTPMRSRPGSQQPTSFRWPADGGLIGSDQLAAPSGGRWRASSGGMGQGL